ncbi:MAG: rod shape-determining protein RodA [Nitrospinae bacterium]|nr:rod shape-determining protein RodA [Nitrospinota bacterium]
MFDRRLITNFDWPLFLLTLLITVVGLVTLYSASLEEGGQADHVFTKQIYWLIYGLIAMAVVLAIDYHYLARTAYLLYAATIIGLVAVAMTGKVISGAQRWLKIGSMTFQVSEMAKLSLTVVLARYFSEGKGDRQYYYLKDLIVPCLLILVPFALIVKQPDLGTALLFVIISFAIVFVIEMNFASMIKLMSAGTVAVFSMWFFLKDYQKNRLMNLFSPEQDPLGTGYHAIQSKIAIGSGGVLGKGLFAGTQSRLNFLPEKHTDFIFSVFAEETGFVGSLLLIILYVIFLVRCFQVISRSKDRFGVLLATGIIASFSCYIILNIGMTVGLFPIVGVPLPLMSYGGSSLITTFIGVGLLLNIKMRRFIELR